MGNVKYTLQQLTIKRGDRFKINDDKIHLDTDWLNISIQSSTEEYDASLLRYQYRSPVFTETMSTAIGGHFTLNPAYSWGPTSDMHYKGRMHGSETFAPNNESVDIGMGRYYSESIQINSKIRTLIIEAGVPEFKSSFSFMFGAVDTAKVIIARDGRTPFFYNLGKGVGTIVSAVAFPIFTAAFYIIGYIKNRLFGLYDPRYYSVRPTMPAFFTKVNTIVNTLAADRGVLTLTNNVTKAMGKKDNPQKQGHQVRISEVDKERLSTMMPHIFKKNDVTGLAGLIDVAGIVGRYQTIVYDNLKLEAKAFEQTELDIDVYVSMLQRKDPKSLNDFIDDTSSLPSYRKKDPLSKEERPFPKTTSADIDIDTLKKVEADGRLPLLPHDKTNWLNSISKYYKAGIDNGMDFVALQVEYVGASTDTFSNTVKDIPMKSFVNGISNRIRDVKFSMSDGNFINDAVKTVTDSASDIIKGFIDGATFDIGVSSLISGLTGGGNINFPQMWDDSNIQLASHTFKLHLNSPYNNPLSLIMDLDIPLSVILALATPQSAGRAAYTSPYYLKTFMRGIMNADISMLTQLSISRGGGNLGHTVHGAPLDLEITFTITDLDPAVHSPTPSGMSGLYGLSLDEYSGINRYTKLISGQSYMYSKFLSKSSLLRITKQYGGLQSVFSPERIGMMVSDSFIGRAHSMFRSPDLSSMTMFGDD